MRTGFLHDKSRCACAPIAHFRDTCNKVNKEQSYQIWNISLTKCKSVGIFKLTEVTKLTGAKMETLNIERRQKSQDRVMTCENMTRKWHAR